MDIEWPVEDENGDVQFLPWQNPGFIPVMASLAKPTQPKRIVALTRIVDIETLCDAGCRNHGSKICASCKAARYCSAECQRRSWKRHKPLCKKIKDLNVKLSEACEKLLKEYGPGTEEGFMKVWSLTYFL